MYCEESINVELGNLVEKLRNCNFKEYDIDNIVKCIKASNVNIRDEKEKILIDIRNDLRSLLDTLNNPKIEAITLTIDEASKYTGIGRDSIMRLLKKHNTDFPHFKVGSKYLINKEMLDTWMEKLNNEHKII